MEIKSVKMADLKNTRYDQDKIIKLIIDALDMYTFFSQNASGVGRTKILEKINHAISTYGVIFPAEFSYVKKEREKNKEKPTKRETTSP